MKYLIILLLLYALPVTGQQKIDTLSIYFENDISAVNPIQEKRIDSLLETSSKIKSIIVEGYANMFASETYNQKLSENRATNVKAIIGDSISVKSIGKGEVESPLPEERRVDIIITYKEKTIEAPQFVPPETSLEISLSEANIGDTVILEGILFIPGLDVIREESLPTLYKVKRYLLENPAVKFKVLGHVCCGINGEPSPIDGRNNRTGNLTLSRDRAKAVYRYLLKEGINASRMSYEGMAFKFPLGKGDIKDRRVEIEIISN
ncbi:OmpA family protein [Patiriisocius hiemis]|uniref:OmpA family protein n=1 Tax=Patiriisocius hiemis TaxID=3075604 RepID=A0ABU2YD31_9FLAO|nr:OmpA family protein [Constantimarinum sp. W242]MDT0556071.1 OmpA family protein [Constantimarinum sp. W242]